MGPFEKEEDFTQSQTKKLHGGHGVHGVCPRKNGKFTQRAQRTQSSEGSKSLHGEHGAHRVGGRAKSSHRDHRAHRVRRRWRPTIITSITVITVITQGTTALLSLWVRLQSNNLRGRLARLRPASGETSRSVSAVLLDRSSAFTPQAAATFCSAVLARHINAPRRGKLNADGGYQVEQTALMSGSPIPSACSSAREEGAVGSAS